MRGNPHNHLHEDIFGHKQEIKNQIGGLGQHYGGARGCGYENLRMMIIEKVEQGNSGLLVQREIFWQKQLRCFVENGGFGLEMFFQFSIEKIIFNPELTASFIVENGK